MSKQNFLTPSQSGAKEIEFPPKPDGHMDRRTDISNYRLASLLIITWENVKLLISKAIIVLQIRGMDKFIRKISET